jgi:hypothetical protein
MIVKLRDMPLEQIVRIDVLAMVVNKHIDIFKDGRIVDLACGHKLLTKALNQARCPRCCEMLRRSIADGSEDWNSFRKGLVRDDMAWEGDILRIYNEMQRER